MIRMKDKNKIWMRVIAILITLAFLSTLLAYMPFF